MERWRRKGERRMGIDRRVFSYSHCIPERRSGNDQRKLLAMDREFGAIRIEQGSPYSNYAAMP